MAKFVINTRSVSQNEQVGEIKPGKFQVNEKGKEQSKEDKSKKEDEKRK